ncbi:DinB family protein [Nocardioides sp. B-3]|uniref:DinB family protein n=1 Tax=Nocardioides sp. B-3 TaxID=2895565 RepID=UPI00215388A9|nr:DinB family protein [Nocardioides sp. B-3]UUZ60175.1 DinB family protein [Nocardioides sp. B-3]
MANPGYNGMWLPQDRDPRMQETQTKGELACPVGYLEHYRATLELKCRGLTPEQLGTRSVPPSNMSLLGLVRHMARVEQSWFRRVIEGQMDLPRHFQDEAFDGGFNWPGEVDEALVDEARALWREEVEHAREVLAGTTLDTLVDVHGKPSEVRDLIVHMIEEYARHCGHADLIRECIDGRAGQ